MEWYLIVGVLLVGVALTASLVDQLPLTLAVVYLGIGTVLGPWAVGLLDVGPVPDASWVERVAEAAIVVSLFGAGLRVRLSLRDRAWAVPVRLAIVSMTLTIATIALAGWALLGISVGLAVLLGAILAPTDPVLAAEVQVDDPWDRDRLRLGLTAEAGLNDGAAFPFVLLGLGLLNLHDLGPWGVSWIAWDVIGTSAGGLVFGGLVATAVARVVLHIRLRYGHAVGLDGFLMLGVAALIYGSAQFIHVSGFLAVFAGGLALRSIERRAGDETASDTVDDLDEESATDADQAPAYLAHSLLDRNEQLERVGEVGLVVLMGAMLADVGVSWSAIAIAVFAVAVARPIAVYLSLIGADISPVQRRLTAWFGLRGVGSLYYLVFALQHGVAGEDAGTLERATLATVALSIIVHGISATPLLNRYRRGAERASPGDELAAT